MAEDFITEQLRKIQSLLAQMRETQLEHGMRLSLLDHQMSGMQAQYATVSDRLDRVSTRLDRIEQRLELVE